MKFWYNPNFLAIAALLVLSIPALKSLAIPGFYTSHDGETHTARIAQYYKAITDGQFPPRFAGSFYNGLGSPIFVYIYPLPYILGSAIHATGLSFTDSFKILMASGFIFSGVFSYLWLREVFGSEKAAFLGALFYMWVPYRFLLIYVRGSLSEMLAYTFLPLVFYSATRLAQEKNVRWVAATSLSFSLLLASQNLVAMITAPIIAIYIFILAVFAKSSKFLAHGIIAGFWGAAIAAFVYLPSLFERGFVRFNQIISQSYVNHFVTLKQLIRSPWGYGFDLPGTVSDQMSFQVGLAHLFIFVVATILIVYLTLRKFMFPKKVPLNFIENASPNILILSLFFLVISLVLIFLMLNTQLTVYTWQHVRLLNFVDLPWRFLGPATLALSFLAAFVTKVTKLGLFFLFLVAFVLVANRNHLRINLALQRDDDFFQNYIGTATQYDEFTPIWRQTTRVPIGFDPNVNVELITGQANISNVLAKSNIVSFDTQAFSKEAQVRVNKFYFPEWKVKVDGKRLTPFKDLTVSGPASLRLDKEQDSSGLMVINLTNGTHKIVAKFTETPLRLFANYLTLGSLILALGIIIKNAKV